MSFRVPVINVSVVDLTLPERCSLRVHLRATASKSEGAMKYPGYRMLFVRLCPDTQYSIFDEKAGTALTDDFACVG
jgi:glyceraldehyde-3-phosphate dehydrogenase/erythrose-4-phosphate dehydrogenase